MRNTEQEYELLFNEYKPLVSFIASLFLDDKSVLDDVVQETFVDFFTNIGKIKNYKAYLTTVAKQISWKANKNKDKDILMESMDVFCVDNIKKHIDESAAIDKLHSILSIREINIVFAYLIGGYTFKEIGVDLGINEKTIKTTYYRALKKCRKENVLNEKD